VEYIFVTLCHGNIEEDLKVPAYVPVGELIGMLNELYSTDGQMLHAEPKGIILDKKKTFAEQYVEHGARLTLS